MTMSTPYEEVTALGEQLAQAIESYPQRFQNAEHALKAWRDKFPLTQVIADNKVAPPVGAATVAGAIRINTAMKAFEEAREEVAHVATQLCRSREHYREIFKAAAQRLGDEDVADAIEELFAVVEHRANAEDDFTRAVAGLPSRR